MFIPLRDRNPTELTPVFTILIILTNIFLHLYKFLLGPVQGQVFLLKAGAIPFEITHLIDTHPTNIVPIPATIFTSMFLHGDLLHLFGNMLFLWIFGNNVEDAFGHLRFLVFYLITGVIAALSHILTAPNSPVPMIGASGAISGVLGAYFLLYPMARIQTLVLWFIVELPAFIVLGFWFLSQVLYSFYSSGSGGGGIAWYAHIGGFLAGLFLQKYFIRKGFIRKRLLKRYYFFR